LALALLLGSCVFIVRYFTSADRWVGYLTTFTGQASTGRVLDRDGDVLSYVDKDGKRCYYDNPTVRRATLHAVGDRQGLVGSGALTAFSSRLSGYNLLTGTYSPLGAGNDLYLTLDARLNYEAHQAMNGHKGTVAVYNYETGQILCMYSAPNYDPADPPQIEEGDLAYEGVYVNRFLGSTYPPGSTFKLVTLAAAIENIPDWETRTFQCTGSVQVGTETVTCQRAHGSLNLKSALAVSCNGVFSVLAAELGPEVLEAAAEKAGLTGRYEVNGLPTARGSLGLSSLTTGELGWAGVGQADDLVNPCAMLVYMGAIARRGKAAVPQLILKTQTALNIPMGLYLKRETAELISPGTARILQEYMANNVQVTYGAGWFPNMDVCAKTGTAEVGGGKKPTAWFTGFLRDDDHPYAFVIVMEDAGTAADVAVPVAARVLNALVNG